MPELTDRHWVDKLSLRVNYKNRENVSVEDSSPNLEKKVQIKPKGMSKYEINLNCREVMP
jgi:hypothetical protein